MNFQLLSPDIFERPLIDPEYPGEGEAFYQFKSYKELQSWIEVRNLYTSYQIHQTRIDDIGDFISKKNSKDNNVIKFGFARHGYQKLHCHLHKKKDRNGEDKQLSQSFSPPISPQSPSASTTTSFKTPTKITTNNVTPVSTNIATLSPNSSSISTSPPISNSATSSTNTPIPSCSIIDQQPSHQQPFHQQPPNQPPIIQHPPHQPLINQQPINQQPFNQQFPHQPSINQPSIDQPSIDQPPINQPPFNQQFPHQPSINQPSIDQPSIDQPSIDQPSIDQPPINQQPPNQLPINQPPINQLPFNQAPPIQQFSHQPLPHQQFPQQISQQPPPHQQFPHQPHPSQPLFNQQHDVQASAINPPLFAQTPSQQFFNGQVYNGEQPFVQPYNGEQPFNQSSFNQPDIVAPSNFSSFSTDPLTLNNQHFYTHIQTNQSSDGQSFNQLKQNEIHSNPKLHSSEDDLFPTMTYKKPSKFKTSQPSNKEARGCKSSITITLNDYVYHVIWRTKHNHDHVSRDYANKLPINPFVRKYIYNLYLNGIQTEFISRMIRKLQKLYKNDKFMFNELLKLDKNKLNYIRVSVIDNSKNLTKGINDIIEKIEIKVANNESAKVQNIEENLPGSQSNPIEIDDANTSKRKLSYDSFVNEMNGSPINKITKTKSINETSDISDDSVNSTNHDTVDTME
ncbi:uncharacterized protein KGF55_003465 [Candida pseudojiufengensis]|uniref:uncharacterized protein n=1 Tax=Candida pseudojiufengensis TaxID=497109 RepID=UPI002223F5AC|nr:uncharacterized protein KGF55_003465 [Candida pseudojiufengensis]KAI5962389.1 hypothetical protein KGF55_003465 [Candida pseudojiufengensis]